MDKRVKWLVILLVVILMDCAGKGFLPPTIVPEAAGSQRAFLPIVTEPGPVLYVGDKVIASVPGVAPGEVAINYHLSDAILSLEERRYAGDVDFDGGERLAEIALGVGVHALQGSDKPYAGHPDLFRLRYGRLLDTALGMGERVVAVNIPWLNWLPEKLPRGERWNQIILEEAGRRGVCVVDAWAVMWACGMGCISEDGYHPNAAGYELIAAEVERCR